MAKAKKKEEEVLEDVKEDVKDEKEEEKKEPEVEVAQGYNLDDFKMSEDDIKEISKEAEDSLKDDSQVPISFLDEGRCTFRIYPDRDPSGRIRIMRRVWAHRLPNKKWLPGNETVQDILKQFESQGHEKTFKYMDKEYGLMMVHIFSSNYKERLTEGRDVCLVLRDWQVRAFNEWLTSLSAAEKVELLDPTNKAIPITMEVIGKEFKNEVKFMLTEKKAVDLPPMKLPAGVTWPGLDKILIDADAKPDERDLKYLRNTLTKEMGRGPIHQPEQDGEGAGHKFSASKPWGDDVEDKAEKTESAPASEVKKVEGDKPCQLADAVSEEPEMAEDYGQTEFGFGKYPPKNDSNPYCLSCPHQIDCMDAKG